MKTALDLFIEKITLKKTETDIYLYPRISFEDVLKAKEIEKEQIIDAYAQGFIESERMDKGAEQYYNETFKNVNNG
jgi:hypothetical protein